MISAVSTDGTTGSVFCPYSDTSTHYDGTRVPLGISATLGAFANTRVPLGEQHLLDVGGGTGTFAQQVQAKFAKVTLLEYDGGMLGQARARLAGTTVECQQGSADALPFEDNSFDAITCNQVIHHFPQADNYRFLAKVFAECCRVLRPGGAMVLNHSTEQQHRLGYWWFQFMPKAADAYCKASPPMPLCLKYFRRAGFTVDEGETYVPLAGTLMSEASYLAKYKLEGAFVPEYRDGDSGFTMGAKTNEIESMQAAIREIQAAGKEDEWIAKVEAARKRVGQASFVIARKPY